jgi:hypothetical protein
MLLLNAEIAEFFKKSEKKNKPGGLLFSESPNIFLKFLPSRPILDAERSQHP